MCSSASSLNSLESDALAPVLQNGINQINEWNENNSSQNQVI